MKRTSSGGFSIYQWWSRNDDVNRGRGYLDDDEESDGAQADGEPLRGIEGAHGFGERRYWHDTQAERGCERCLEAIFDRGR